jgi:hypothetical protein
LPHDQVSSAFDPVCCPHIVALERIRHTRASGYCTLRVVFGKVGLVAAVGSGEGVLTLYGKRYGFLVAGASIGPTLALSTNVLHGTALNISTPGDLAGTYTGVGGGAAVTAGVSGVRLRN